MKGLGGPSGQVKGSSDQRIKRTPCDIVEHTGEETAYRKYMMAYHTMSGMLFIPQHIIVGFATCY